VRYALLMKHKECLEMLHVSCCWFVARMDVRFYCVADLDVDTYIHTYQKYLDILDAVVLEGLALLVDKHNS
jgi:hypothetical protein